MKKWYTSKTLLVNILSIAIIVIQYCIDVRIMPLEVQAPVLAIINILLRIITSEPIKKKR